MGWNEVTAAWVQAGSAIIAIVAVFLAPIASGRLQERKARRLAAMELVVRLRGWMRHTVVTLRTIENRALGDGTAEFSIPPLPYTRSFHNVMQMSHKQARRLLGCLEERELILAEARATAFFENYWCAEPVFVQRTAKLMLDVVGLISELCKAAAWPDPGFDSRIINDLNKAVAKPPRTIDTTTPI